MASTFIVSYADFMAHEFDDGEILAFGCCRGEAALLAGVTNKGKSTLIRVIAMCAASGRGFPPFVSASTEGLRVLLLDYEGSGGRTQADLGLMAQNLTRDEQELLAKNLFISHAPRLNGDDPLTLSLPAHMTQLREQARKFAPDIIIVDTLGAAFAQNSENDNAEIGRMIMKPVIDYLARLLHCVCVVVGHVGKDRAEAGLTRQPVHRMRGGSAYADRATSIFNVDGDPDNEDRILVTCAKEKTGNNFEITLELNRETRWLTVVEGEATRTRRPTVKDKVLGVLTHSSQAMKTEVIVRALANEMSESAVKQALTALGQKRLASQPRHGYWKAGEPKIIIDVEEPPEAKVQSAIAHKALHDCTINDNRHNSLGESAESADSYVNLHDCTIAEQGFGVRDSLPNVIVIPASVPNTIEANEACLDSQRHSWESKGEKTKTANV